MKNQIIKNQEGISKDGAGLKRGGEPLASRYLQSAAMPMPGHVPGLPRADWKPAPRLQTMNTDGICKVVALGSFSPGALLLQFDGDLVDRPTRYSVQVGKNLHIIPPKGLLTGIDDQKFIYRFLNHSCRPNAKVAGRQVIAIRPIARLEEVTFDYNTTELAMASPFICWCGHCGGRHIAGFSNLSDFEKQELLPYVADYLQDFALSFALPGLGA
jgi:hypothetical protein